MLIFFSFFDVYFGNRLNVRVLDSKSPMPDSIVQHYLIATINVATTQLVYIVPLCLETSNKFTSLPMSLVGLIEICNSEP